MQACVCAKLSPLNFKAVEDYHNQIGNVANMVLEELREHFGDLYHSDEETSITHDTMEERFAHFPNSDVLCKFEYSCIAFWIFAIDRVALVSFSRRQKLIYHLNASGKYFAFKEQLKHAVVKIVREKYLKTANFANKEELQVRSNF